MSSFRLLLALPTFALAACATPSQPSPGNDKTTGVLAQAGPEFQLAIGETARIDGTTSRITFRSVAEDSRCPADVRCVWAGNARLLLTLSTDGRGDSSISVNTGIEPRSALVSGHLLRVTSLTPQPRAGIAIPPNSYVAKLALAAL